jgi:hypothetical protein
MGKLEEKKKKRGLIAKINVRAFFDSGKILKAKKSKNEN